MHVHSLLFLLSLSDVTLQLVLLGFDRESKCVTGVGDGGIGTASIHYLEADFLV